MVGSPMCERMRSIESTRVMKEVMRQARERASMNPDTPIIVQKEHQAIFEAITDGDPSRAREAALVHLRNAFKRQGIQPLTGLGLTWGPTR